MTKVLVLGSTGMLGSAVFTELLASGLDVKEASRTRGLRFDANDLNVRDLLDRADLNESDYIVNCVGLTKSRIDEKSISSRASAVRLNIDFPNTLALEARKSNLRVVQVATDCVFRGSLGGYLESSPHDALDVYGKSKSLGEAPDATMMHLRCSLIGPEQGRNSLFFEWVRQQPVGAQVLGYTDHLWNGLTSAAFGRIVSAIVRHGLHRPGVQHLVPADKVTKDELVRMVLEALGRKDVLVEPTAAPTSIDRTLATNNSAFNQELFKMAGYSSPPTIAHMVNEICANLPR